MIKNLVLTPGRIAGFFASIVGLLLTANLVFLFMEHVLDLSFHSIHIFYFNSEANLPAVYSSLSMAFVSVMLWMVGNLGTGECIRSRKYWRLLSVVFFFLAIDELVSIHESLTDNAEDLLNAHSVTGIGWLYFAWIVPYVGFFAVMFALMVHFLLSLPRKTLLRFLVAGVTFIAGSVGMEMVGGQYVYLNGGTGKQDLTYALMVTVEEVLEMSGIVIFIYALADYYLLNSPGHSMMIHIRLTQHLKHGEEEAHTLLNTVKAETTGDQ